MEMHICIYSYLYRHAEICTIVYVISLYKYIHKLIYDVKYIRIHIVMHMYI
jgi:hypothetical protein